MNDGQLHDEIAEVAYELYEKSSRFESRYLIEIWYEAEKIVMNRYREKEGSTKNLLLKKKYQKQEN